MAGHVENQMNTPIEIQIEELSKSFGAQCVLDRINLTIVPGEVVAIVGGSGCGKTVLLNHVLSLMAPDCGRVLVADHDAPDTPLRDLAQLSSDERDRIHTHWGVVFQRNALFSGSVLENIALWLREVGHEDERQITLTARSVLESVGLPTDDEFLARPHDALSGGMAKRLAVARAVATDPAVIFYDEPTTGLDPTSAAQIHLLILSLHNRSQPGKPARTTMIITHDKDLLQRLRPRVVMLHEGSVHFDGSFESFRRSPSQIIRPYFELMAGLHQRGASA
jgi:phospholipid/cholesterol/gamma-HCH transport system ATP-binding protein